jgi:type III restriction enzyme
MAKEIKFKFDDGQPHQTRAIESTLNLFKGFEKSSRDFELGDGLVHNRPEWYEFDEELLRANYESVIDENNQRQNPDGVGTSIIPNWIDAKSDGQMLRDTKFDVDTYIYPVFTLEMETGTGKTFTYLKTMFELKQQYGFTKFIIVVPSIAIYEGTLQALRQTKEHFKSRYRNEIIIPVEYKLSNILKYATSSSLEAMIITIDSFNKAGINVIYQPNDGFPDGLPIEYIQKTRPILILDESQNYTSEKSEEALRTLKPLFALNYSATPKKGCGLIYRLSPFDAFRDNLVKKIEVLGVTQYDNANDDNHKIFLVKTVNDRGAISAKLQVFVIHDGIKSWQEIIVKKGDNLYQKTKNPDLEGFIVEDIYLRENKVTFTNQSFISGESTTGITLSEKEVRRIQIEETIKIHFDKQRRLKDSGIKVLTLFFIDYVPNYLGEEPFLRTYFENAFNKFKKNDDYFKNFNAKEVHDGYFARKKDNTPVEDFDEITSKDREEARKKSYERIMQAKEKLLSFDDKVCFIFAHSAIREGWDNPNVFNICLLKQPHYKTDKQKDSRRQELGRGLRICVNQSGERVGDEGINILTVICPEDFSQYVNALQNEYIESGELNPPPKPSNYKGNVKRKDAVYYDKDFRKFWNTICKKTSYNINISTPDFIKECSREFNDNVVFPETKIKVSKGKYNFYRYTFSLVEARLGYARVKVTIIDIHGKKHETTQWVKQGETFTRAFLENYKDIRLKDFTVVKINETDISVTFSNSETITRDSPYSFEGNPLESLAPEYKQATQSKYPVFDFISRTAFATSLTRPTILKVFNLIRNEKKEMIFINPEGFTAIFIQTIKELLADHVASKIEYILNEIYPNSKYDSQSVRESDQFTYQIPSERDQPALFAAETEPSYGDGPSADKDDFAEFFPPLVKFPQRELIEGSEHSLYTDIQTDSAVEKNFIEKKIKTEDKEGKIICYFKFPVKFKIFIPKILGNFYNPDWGIIRFDKKGNTKVQLVRETKGSEDLTKLRFSNEGRKIKCGKKHFKAIGISYRPVTDTTIDWYSDELE